MADTGTAWLTRVEIAGFKSIRELDLTLRPLNVLIGANGAGKSNFLGFFKLVQMAVSGAYDLYEDGEGGLDSILHYGRERTTELRSRLHRFDRAPLNLQLIPPQLPDATTNVSLDLRLFSLVDIRQWRVYHFHDTAPLAAARQAGDARDYAALAEQGNNLAAFLYNLWLGSLANYEQIRDTIRLVAPFFDDFSLEPSRSQQILLEWRDRSGAYFKSSALSDGTLSFMCLAALLLQPDPPRLLLIDEPELGLHPYAISLLAAMLKSASTRTQIIVSTQSVTLLDQLDDPEDVLVVDRKDEQSTFRRLQQPELEAWLEEYSLGELWQKNVLGGRP